jgi:ABC-type transporter MlaC component
MASLTLIVRRRTIMAMACLIPLIGIPAVYAATPAEAFVADNIQKGLGTLNDPKLSAGERSEQFERLLLSITDMNRVATFTLGQYAQTASPADRAAFAAAFQSYSVAVYRSYLTKYAGQTLLYAARAGRTRSSDGSALRQARPDGRRDRHRRK